MIPHLFKFSVLMVLLAALVACGSSAASSDQAMERNGTTRVKATVCVQTNPHPVAQNIADNYEVSYGQVMEWFCEGSSFDDIMLALETRKLTEIPVEDLLVRAEQTGWDQLWAETGLTEPMGTDPEG